MITSLLSTALIAYLVVMLLVYFMQGSLLFLPNLPGRALSATPLDIGLPYQDIAVETSDGITLHGWFVPAENAPLTVLIFHGNAGNISHRLDTINIWHQLGANTFIIDYRGYGQSTGSPSEQGSYRDARGAWKYLVEQRGIPAAQIVLFGRSLGGAVAAQLASEVAPAALVIESSFTSVPDIAADVYAWLPVKLLSRFSYNTRLRASQVSCPVLVVHSRQDDIIPFKHGQAIFAAAHEPKTMLVLHGGHNEGFMLSAIQYKKGLADFLATIGPDQAITTP